MDNYRNNYEENCHEKHILTLLIIALILPTIASCGTGKETLDTTPSDTVDTTVETEPETDALEARLTVSDNLPDADFGGQTFAIIGDDGFDYILADEMTGEVVNDAIYTRNNNVCERFNVNIACEAYSETVFTNQAKNLVLSGDDSFQMVSGHIILLGMTAVNDIMFNWYDLPHIDFSMPWWSPSTEEDLRYKNKAFIAIGDFALSALAQTYCMFYNKDLAEAHNLPDMYEVVTNGEWTFDKMYALSDGVYVDVDGDGARSDDDRYALATSCKSPANAYLWAFGKKIATQQPDYTYKLNYYDEKLVSIVERLYNMYYETDYVHFDPDSHHFMSWFADGNCLFSNGLIEMAISDLREAESDYGIIPYPKWDVAQEEYYTSVDGGHEGLAILKSISDLEFVGTISEALCAESWKHVVPAYYDVALKFKGTRDQRSVEMLDAIVQSRVFDFGYVYGGWGCVFWIQYMMEQKSKDITSYYEKNFASYENTMDKVFKAFDEYAVG